MRRSCPISPVRRRVVKHNYLVPGLTCRLPQQLLAVGMISPLRQYNYLVPGLTCRLPQQLHTVGMITPLRQVHGCQTAVVLQKQVGPALQQKPHVLQVAVLGGQMQRRL